MEGEAGEVVVDVCSVLELPDGEVAVAEQTPVGRLAVFFTEGGYFGLEDRCSHQDAWLSDGFVEDCAVECPLHASTFDLRTGRPDGPPATTPVRTFRAGAVDGRVVLFLPSGTGTASGTGTGTGG